MIPGRDRETSTASAGELACFHCFRCPPLAGLWRGKLHVPRAPAGQGHTARPKFGGAHQAPAATAWPEAFVSLGPRSGWGGLRGGLGADGAVGARLGAAVRALLTAVRSAFMSLTFF